MLELALLIVFPLAMAYAASSDLLTMTIPNELALALVAGFLVLAPLCGLGLHEMLTHTGAALLVLAATFAMFAFGWIGGGDAKLAAATALWLGFEGLPDYLVLSAVAGGALTLGLLAARQMPLPTFAGRWPWAARLHDEKTGIPYGIALAGAALAIYPQSGIWLSAFGR